MRSEQYDEEVLELLDEVKGPSFEDTPKKSAKTKNKKKILLIIIIIACIVVIGLGIVFIKLLTPTIKLKGESKIKLTINSEYTDLGATAKFVGKDASSKIKTSGTVKTDKKGTYTITYSIKKLLFESKVKRTVTVLEDGPTITLEGNKETSICPNAEYEEIGFTATNKNEDDLKDKVKTKVEKDLVTYTIKDNDISFTTTRKLVREDKEAPELKLNGNDHIYVTLGIIYNEQKATATDKCDGDLSEKVVIEGSVDVNTLGDYDINYKVSDEAGNEATASRKVTVQKEVVRRNASLACGQAGVIYLTFDDGPGGSSTTSILNTLKKYNVKATFFVSSANGGSDDLIKREYDEGHLIALHTNSHEYSDVYRSDEAYFNDLNKISDRVERITGQKSKIIRFPGGSSNTVSRRYSSGIMSRLAASVEAKGYTYVDWNVDSRDAENKPCDDVYRYATGGLSKSSGNVVLMHDIKSATACALPRIIEYGQNNGYTFKTLDSSVVCHHKTAN